MNKFKQFVWFIYVNEPYSLKLIKELGYDSVKAYL